MQSIQFHRSQKLKSCDNCRHFNGDVITVIIIRNVKNFENLMELLDAFDQAGPSNSRSSNNGYNCGDPHNENHFFHV